VFINLKFRFDLLEMRSLAAALSLLLVALVNARVSSIRVTDAAADVRNQVEALDLTRARTQLVKWHPTWAEEKVTGAVAEYRRFLAIGIAHGQVGGLTMPASLSSSSYLCMPGRHILCLLL
jgi:hypothetical protein